MGEKLTPDILKRLQGWFKIGYKAGGKNTPPELFAVKNVNADKKSTPILEKIPFDDNVKKLFDYWISDTHTTEETWKSMNQVYQDMDLLYYNSQIVSKAIELTADEVLQADNNDQIIFVEAKAKLKKFIYEFFDKINLNDHIRPAIVDIVQYGNGGWILGFDKTGVNEIIPISVYSLKSRMEFTPYEVEAKLKQDNNFKKYSKYDRVSQLIDSILERDNNNSYFKKYLFGFQIEDTIIPPWKFIHFRNMTNKSAFAPFGIPAFIHSMSAYRQYDAAMGLQQTARAYRFPKGIFSLDLPASADPDTKLNKAIEFLNAMNNSGLGMSKKEVQGLGDMIITIKGLYEYTQENMDIDLGKIDDIQMLKDDIILSTFLPRDLLDPNSSGFGDSGVSLIQKFKPFARQIYRYQNIFLQNITQLVKLHCIYSGQFQPEEIDFVLSMKYPESQTNSDIVSSQNGLLDLANNIISTIQDKITGGEGLPPELIKSIYHQFLPYDTTKVDMWIDEALKAKEKKEKEAEEQNLISDSSNDFSFDDSSSEDDNEPKEKITSEADVEDQLDSFSNAFNVEEKVKKKRYQKYYLVEKTLGKQKLLEKINDIILEKKQETLREYNYGGRHFFSSKNKNADFEAEKMFEFDKKRVNLLKELTDKQYNKKYCEEVKVKEYKLEEAEVIKMDEEIDDFFE